MAKEDVLGGAVGGATTGASIGGPWGAAIGGVAGGLLGGLQKKKTDPRLEAAQRMASVYSNYNVPSLEDRLYEIYDLEQQGLLTPELEAAILQQETQLEDVEIDPRLRNAQMDALLAMQERAGGGLTAQELQNLEQIRQAQETQSAADRQAIMQSRARRGIAGGGDELASQLQAAQQSALQAGSRGSDLASMMGQARMQATEQYGQMAGQVRGQDYGQEADKARAQDIINQFNVDQRSGVQQRNVGSKNLAASENLKEKQRIADINRQLATQRSLLQQQARLGYSKDELDRQLGAAGKDMLNTTSGMEYDKYQSKKNADFISSLGSGVKDLYDTGIFSKKKTSSGGDANVGTTWSPGGFGSNIG